MELEPGLAKHRLRRLALASIAQTVLELLFSITIFTESGLQTAYEQVYKDIAYQIVIFVGNLQRGWTLSELIGKLKRTDEDGEPDICGALDDNVRIIIFNPMALSVWYLLQYVMRGCILWEALPFAAMIGLNLGHFASWYRLLRDLNFGVRTLFVLERVTDAVTSETCVICLEGFSEGHKVGRMPCDHTFHQACISKWLERQEQCPLRCHARSRSKSEEASTASTSTTATARTRSASTSTTSEEGAPRAGETALDVDAAAAEEIVLDIDAPAAEPEVAACGRWSATHEVVSV
jgi:hypothetical protein